MKAIVSSHQNPAHLGGLVKESKIFYDAVDAIDWINELLTWKLNISDMMMKGRGETPAAKANSPATRTVTGTQPGTYPPAFWIIIMTARPAKETIDMKEVTVRISCGQ